MLVLATWQHGVLGQEARGTDQLGAEDDITLTTQYGVTQEPTDARSIEKAQSPISDALTSDAKELIKDEIIDVTRPDDSVIDAADINSDEISAQDKRTPEDEPEAHGDVITENAITEEPHKCICPMPPAQNTDAGTGEVSDLPLASSLRSTPTSSPSNPTPTPINAPSNPTSAPTNPTSAPTTAPSRPSHRVLFLGAITGRSHKALMLKLAQGLIQRGHQVRRRLGGDGSWESIFVL